MTYTNPTDIFIDFKNGKIDSSSTIRKLILMSRGPINDKPRNEITDILLEMYRTAETKEMKKFMVEELGKEFLIYFDLSDPREGMGLKLLEIDTDKEVTTDSGASQHYVDFSIKIVLKQNVGSSNIFTRNDRNSRGYFP